MLYKPIFAKLEYHFLCISLFITLFRLNVGIFYRIMSIPQNIVIDMNNVMLHSCSATQLIGLCVFFLLRTLTPPNLAFFLVSGGDGCLQLWRYLIFTLVAQCLE